MNVDRLNHLITILEEAVVKEKSFYMGAWGKLDERKPNICNTASCALGTAAMNKQCIEDGLVMMAFYDNDDERITWPLTDRTAWDRAFAAMAEGHGVDLVPRYDEREGFYAGMEYYEINEEQANYLFDPSQYEGSTWDVKPYDVIVHVRDVLNGHLVDGDDSEYDDDPLDDEQAKPTEGFV